MAKHVFNLNRWGSFEYLGELVKETDKTVTFMRNRGSSSRQTRNDKTRYTRVFETDNPEAVVAAFNAEWKVHEPAIKDAQKTLKDANDHQRIASFEAAFGGDVQ